MALVALSIHKETQIQTSDSISKFDYVYRPRSTLKGLEKDVFHSNLMCVLFPACALCCVQGITIFDISYNPSYEWHNYIALCICGLQAYSFQYKYIPHLMYTTRMYEVIIVSLFKKYARNVPPTLYSPRQYYH